jgi:hypothetical protein
MRPVHYQEVNGALKLQFNRFSKPRMDGLSEPTGATYAFYLK